MTQDVSTGTGALPPTPSLLERYQQAAALAPERAPALLRNRRLDPIWTGQGDLFWYRRETPDGEEFVLVDPETGAKRIAGSLEELGVTVPASAPAGVFLGPDGRGLLCRDHDLWLVGADGVETQVTTDGEAGFGWGEFPENNNMVVPLRRMGVKLPPLLAVLSPSGRRVLAVRNDQRSMPAKHMLEHVPISGAARPECHEYLLQLEDEGDVPASEARVVDLESGAWVDVDVTDGLTGMLTMNGCSEVTWSADESRLFMLNRRTGGPSATLVEVDVTTGTRRDVVVLEEGPLYEANQFLYSLPLVRVLPETDEAILFSQRDGWGHLYLYDLRTGEAKNAVSAGDLVVRDILHVDARRREITYLAGGGEGNPLWRKVYRAGLDGGTQRLLTPEPADHDLVAPQPQFFHLVFGQGKPPVTSISPSGRFFVDHQSTVSDPPIILLRDASDSGRVVIELERTDISRLLDAGYVIPQSFCVKADDGVTDLWGVIALPAHPVDPANIPVIEDVYGGFQIPHAGTSFLGGGMSSRQGGLAAYNALGFAGVLVDGRGTPGRHRDFRQLTFQQFHTQRGLEDHVTVLTALAKEHPLDMTRIGVIGHSYGGYNAARLLLMFPDFYKAAVSSAGVHDPRKTARGQWDWHMGPDYDRTSANYLALGNLHLAERLQGELLIVCGEIDENATLDHSFALADALIKAGKRFDFKVWPGLNHYQQGAYVHMAFYDHFVRNLLNADPPPGYKPFAV